MVALRSSAPSSAASTALGRPLVRGPTQPYHSHHFRLFHPISTSQNTSRLGSGRLPVPNGPVSTQARIANRLPATSGRSGGANSRERLSVDSTKRESVPAQD